MSTAQPPATIVPLTQRRAWSELVEHSKNVLGINLRHLFAEDPKRAERFTIDALGLYFDFSKHRITGETIRLLLDLAEQSGLRQHIDAMFAGDKINSPSGAPFCMSRCVPLKGEQILADGVDVVPEVHAVLDKMASFAEQVGGGVWKGHSGKRIRNVINE